MKKVVTILAVFAVLLLLVVGSVGAAAPRQDGEGDMTADEAEVTAEAAEPVQEEAAPEGAAVRIGFELAGQEAKRGLYSVQMPGGAEVASWYALDGWQDSGWISNLDLAKDTVWVQVMYYPGPDTEPTALLILNHVPDEEYGWLSKDTAHALEVAWPDQEIVSSMAEGS